MQPRTCLLTGDAGFVGRHMKPALEAAGWAVTGLDVARGGGEDARDYFRAGLAHYDLVVHLAAVVGGRATIEGAPLSVAVDLSIDAEMFGWALRTRPGRIVYFSSSAAYPVRWQTARARVPLHEDMIDLVRVGNPDLTYGWAKLTGEVLASHVRAAGVPVTVLRPFSGYGPDQDLDYPFPSFIDRALRRADPFEVWGTGTQVRDWVHIDDVVAATLRCIDSDIDGPLNIGWGRATSFLDLAHLVTSVAGYSPRILTRPDAPAGVEYRVCNPTRLREVYQPTITLEQGIAQALEAGR